MFFTHHSRIEITSICELILNAVESFEREALKKYVTVKKIEEAKYALVAALDECVLGSAWSGRGVWKSNPLQLQMFGEHLAGEGFFKRLKKLQQEGADSVDVLEVYYVCLQMGFEGVYRMQGMEQLIALQVDLHNQIEAYRGNIDNRLSPAMFTESSLVKKIGRKLPYWIVFTAMIVVIFFIYLGFKVAVVHDANMARKIIEESHMQLIENLQH